MTEQALTGLILAGGKSSRMGTDKALLDLRGKTLLQHAETLLQQVGCREVIINSNDLAGALADRYQGYGPVAGIEAALDYLLTQDKTGMLVVLPIDMSLLTAETLELLLSEAEPGQITRFKGHPMPMLIPITAAIHELVVNMLKNTTKERGIAIRALCDYVQCSTIPVIDERQSEFFNCNTQDDFQLLKTLTNEHAKDT